MSITQRHTAIITVTFNSEPFIQDYLAAISPFIMSDRKHQLIIVDNISSDNTVRIINEHIKKYNLSQNITLVESTENLGFGKGCNLGALEAQKHTPKYLWLLNPDTQVFANSGHELIQFLDEAPNATFAGSILVNQDKEPRPSAFRFPQLINIFLSYMRLGILDRALHQYTTVTPVKSTPYQEDWLTGASFMVRANHFHQISGFDPFYFLYFEEVDLFVRAKNEGFAAWCCPSSQVFHISGASTGMNNHQKAIKPYPNYWYESRRHFYIKNYGKLYFLIADLVLLASNSFFELRAKIQQKNSDNPPNFTEGILRYSLPGKWLKSLFN